MLHVLRVEDAAGCFILTDRYADDREAAVSNPKKNIFKIGCCLFMSLTRCGAMTCFSMKTLHDLLYTDMYCFLLLTGQTHHFKGMGHSGLCTNNTFVCSDSKAGK